MQIAAEEMRQLVKDRLFLAFIRYKSMREQKTARCGRMEKKMKENKYDEESFFVKYSQMSRSVYGLQGAGEWSAFQKMMPDFTGKKVLDLGCGYGWHCAYAADCGAETVLGTDISEKMLAEAEKRNSRPCIQYQKIAMEDIELPEQSVDVVISSLAFHYVENLEEMIQKIFRWLSPGGDFVFSIEHPVFTAEGSQDWYYDKNGKILHFPVDNYYYEGKREAIFLGERMTKYHRTMTTILGALLKNGFEIKQITEPQPPENMMDLLGMRDEMRRPMMLLVAAVKPAR